MTPLVFRKSVLYTPTAARPRVALRMSHNNILQAYQGLYWIRFTSYAFPRIIASLRLNKIKKPPIRTVFKFWCVAKYFGGLRPPRLATRPFADKIKKPPIRTVFKILVLRKVLRWLAATLPRNSPLCRQNQKTAHPDGF